MKNYLLFIIFLSFFSCEEKKTEFIQSNAIGNLYLIKNPPIKDSLIKKEIESFFIKNPPKYSKVNTIYIYRYSYDTEYFLDHEEDDGGPTSIHFLDQDEDGIAMFTIEKCRNDTTKLLGELRFYNSIVYDFYTPDTIVYSCN